MKSKPISLALAFVVLFGIFGIGAGAESNPAASMANFAKVATYTSGQFDDVDENQWYGKPIATAFEYGLMKGNSATTFGPKGNMKISEAITIAARVHSIYRTGSSDFAESTPWYQVYVDYALEKEIVAGSVFGAADWDRPATRAEMAYIFSRSLPASELPAKNTVNSLPDTPEGYDSSNGQPRTPHRASIIRLYEAGVVAGDAGTNAFRPNDPITRAEAATIISRVILPDTRITGKVYPEA